MSQYCDPSDLPKYLNAAALATTTPEAQLQACIDASNEADAFLRGRYSLPLSAWDTNVRKYTAWIACYLLLTGRGYAMMAGSDKQITDRYYMAVGDPSKPGSGWFPGVQRQAIHPDVTPAQPSPGDPVYDLPQVRTSQQRGWNTYSRGGKPSVG